MRGPPARLPAGTLVHDTDMTHVRLQPPGRKVSERRHRDGRCLAIVHNSRARRRVRVVGFFVIYAPPGAIGNRRSHTGMSRRMTLLLTLCNSPLPGGSGLPRLLGRAGLHRVGGLEMFNTCMPGPTSSLEVLRLHIGGTRGPDAVQAVAGLDLADIDVLAEALLGCFPGRRMTFPPTRCGPW
jgi:hypothetical protein